MIDILLSIESREAFKSDLEVMETGKPIEDNVKINLRTNEYYFLARAFKVGEDLGLTGIDRKRFCNKWSTTCLISISDWKKGTVQ